jgi:hypothetical protein
MKKLIKDYSTTISATRTIGEIQELLAKNGARGIATNYDEEGKVTDVFFKLIVDKKEVAFKLPAKTDKINAGIEKAGLRIRSNPEDVAWRICKSWLEAQITLINLDQAKMEEVFLPYLIVGKNKTLYEAMKEKQFLLPGESE